MTANSKAGFATYAGLFCALVGPLFLFPLRFLLAPHGHIGFWEQEAMVWGLMAVVLCILVFWERLPLSAIGLGRPTWRSLWLGAGGALVVRLVAAAAIFAYAKLSGASLAHAFAHDLTTVTRLGAMPIGILLLLSLRAGVTEEILFRGYGIERLSAVTGNRTIAAMVSLAIFTVAHLGAWDVNYLIVIFPVGLVLTLQYLWRRDLWANMLAHFLTDTASLVGAYAVAHHLVRLPR